jgi:hypothetical protein
LGGILVVHAVELVGVVQGFELVVVHEVDLDDEITMG